MNDSKLTKHNDRHSVAIKDSRRIKADNGLERSTALFTNRKSEAGRRLDFDAQQQREAAEMIA